IDSGLCHDLTGVRRTAMVGVAPGFDGVRAEGVRMAAQPQRSVLGLVAMVLAGSLVATCAGTPDEHPSEAQAGGAGPGTSGSSDVVTSASGEGGGLVVDSGIDDCDASCAAAGGTCKSGVCTIVFNFGASDAATQ